MTAWSEDRRQASREAAQAQRAEKARPADATEAEAARARRDALKVVRKDLARRPDTADMDPWQALARGLIRDGKHLRALAPTRQIGDMAVPSRRRAAILERGELAALAHYHGLWMETRVGLAAVDPERIRVDGGGGGDIGWRYGRAAESERERKRLRAGLNDPDQASVLDWVVILDQPLENFCMKAICPISHKEYVIGARYQLFLGAARGLRRQLAY
ncbi:hypothetical protein FKB34_01865 [Glycocaulis profundi]|nr:hypothetical protein FKB34_01865 [Glycocaulis profundi]